MKRALGVSVYPDHSEIEKDKAYLKKASECGFSRIFMSMLEVTEGKEVVKEKFKSLISYAKDLGYETILDVAPNIFDELQISYDDLTFFYETGADGIRLDVGFDGNKEAKLTFNPFDLAIELNMSNDVAYLDNILTYEANVPFLYGCHNFYPQEGTALPYDFFERCSVRFKKHGIRTAAFINSQAGKIGPWDVNDGLPTLEMHRHLPVDIQAKHLFATGLIDDVIIGNAYASDEELELLGRLNRYQLELAVEFTNEASKVEKEITLTEQHFRRGDITDQVVRSTEVRKKYKDAANPAHDNTHEFQIGDVVIGNDAFGKYKNELQIVLQPHSDDRKNKVGQITEKELLLLDFVKPWTKFRFTEK
ncbi:hypothetical protein UAY_00472 [Enterococcus moraviensis ATCC BAA-383]|uniref:PTS-associated protein n=1 Tax=Enterococcus moraviensis ATCC BAA-383 TaxID=1158609 RepID=R2RFK4_9ENTE|nr:MupG family TIM beta-alpha barrel fold protein [Enterococcus moraviensis]EOI06421.1 hypothetical protein UAY_00472 [Enterococcus moraviensis ATCC BAA-383]EOT63781.1 hypothetical protein I586_03214 [Enterococcus moraviensis ATCC BAA-383]OJG67088.1 hypothetical protein RV09_GL002997 [Enterococcus moraviensis]